LLSTFSSHTPQRRKLLCLRPSESYDRLGRHSRQLPTNHESETLTGEMFHVSFPLPAPSSVAKPSESRVELPRDCVLACHESGRKSREPMTAKVGSHRRNPAAVTRHSIPSWFAAKPTSICARLRTLCVLAWNFTAQIDTQATRLHANSHFLISITSQFDSNHTIRAERMHESPCDVLRGE
jgi:hypothetical protein